VNEHEILDELIDDLNTRRKAAADYKERIKITDQLLKTMALRRKADKPKRGRGFNLEDGNGHPSRGN
jgi:hypothetical protein